jgi:hypothetical protein
MAQAWLRLAERYGISILPTTSEQKRSAFQQQQQIQPKDEDKQ